MIVMPAEAATTTAIGASDTRATSVRTTKKASTACATASDVPRERRSPQPTSTGDSSADGMSCTTITSPASDAPPTE